MKIDGHLGMIEDNAEIPHQKTGGRDMIHRHTRTEKGLSRHRVEDEIEMFPFLLLEEALRKGEIPRCRTIEGLAVRTRHPADATDKTLLTFSNETVRMPPENVNIPPHRSLGGGTTRHHMRLNRELGDQNHL